MTNFFDEYTFLIKYFQGISNLIPDNIMRDKVQWLNFFLFIEETVLLFFWLFFPSIHCFLDGEEYLSWDVEHDGTFWFKRAKNSIVFLIVGKFMEEKIYFF